MKVSRYFCDACSKEISGGCDINDFVKINGKTVEIKIEVWDYTHEQTLDHQLGTMVSQTKRSDIHLCKKCMLRGLQELERKYVNS